MDLTHQYCSIYTILLQLMNNRLDPIRCFSSDGDVTPTSTANHTSSTMANLRQENCQYKLTRPSRQLQSSWQHPTYPLSWVFQSSTLRCSSGRFNGGHDLGRLARKPSCVRMCDGGKTSFDRHTSTRCFIPSYVPARVRF